MLGPYVARDRRRLKGGSIVAEGNALDKKTTKARALMKGHPKNLPCVAGIVLRHSCLWHDLD